MPLQDGVLIACKEGLVELTATIALEMAYLEGMRHIRYVDFDSHGYSIVEVDRERVHFDQELRPQQRFAHRSRRRRVRRAPRRARRGSTLG